MAIANLGKAKLRMTAALAAVILISAPAVRAAGVAATPGEQRRWALHFRVRLDQPGIQKPVEVDLTGDWISTVTAVRSDDYDAALQLANAHVTGAGGGSVPSDALEQTQQRLSRRFWATYRKDGALLAVHFFKDVSPSDRNLLQMIATEAQLVCPDRGESVWRVIERDGAGSYLAIYNRTEPLVVVKRKVKYLDTDGPAVGSANRIRVDMDPSESRFSLDSDGGILTLDGSDRARMGMPLGDGGQLATTTETHLSGLRASSAPELIGSLARALPDVVSSPIVTYQPDPAQARAQRDSRLLEGRGTGSLLEAAMSKDADPTLPDRLAALFRQRPESAGAAIELLRKNGSCQPITDALASAGSPTALHALATLARDPVLPRLLRMGAMIALIRIQQPRPEAMRIPAALLDDVDIQVKSAARMVSGALARAGRAEYPADSDKIDQALIARYRKSREVPELTDLLAAMGNSVGPAIVPVIEEALRDSRSLVRAAAARGLRLATGPDVDRLLSLTIASDSDPSVCAAAIFSAGFRRPLGPLIGEALVRAAREASADYVRSDAVNLLRQHPEASPRVVETLAWVAEHDSRPGVRRLAREAMASVLPQQAR
jgi:hypothetical protein